MEQPNIEESTIKKINNLLSIANHANANENEANIAMGHVMRLLAKYNLDLQEFDRISNPEEDINNDYLENDKQSLPTWKSRLLSTIAKANFCAVYISCGYRHKSQVLVGRPTNTQAVKILYSYLCSVIENETKSAWEQYTGWEHGKTYCNSFRLGMVSRIAKRLQEEQAKVIEETKALCANNQNNEEGGQITVTTKTIVVKNVFQEAQEEIETYYKKVGIKLRSSTYSGVNKSGAGFNKGYEAGGKVPLNTYASLNSRNK
jgi:hypothetical protein